MYQRIPIVDIGASEEAAPGTFGAALPQLMPSDKNFAEDEKVVTWINETLLPRMTATKEQRGPLEDEWNAIRRMEMLQHDAGRSYFGRSNAYLPLYQKALTTRVSALSTGLFPSDDYMDVGSRREDPVSRAKAKLVKAYIQWEFERISHLQQALKPGLRSLENFGNAVFKCWYAKKWLPQGRLRATMNAMLPTPDFRPRVLCEGTFVSPRPLHNVYVYPVTAANLDEAEMVFETIKVPRHYVEYMLKGRKLKNIEEALGSGTDWAFSDKEQEQLATSAAGMGAEITNDSRDHMSLTEVWCFMPLPSQAYASDEDNREWAPAKILLAGNIPVEVIRNPLWHQRSPYLFARTNIQPGLFYGYGVGRIVRDLQYLANDFANQTNDCGNYILNPINKVDPGSVAGPLSPLRPGVTWYFTDIAKGQAFDRPPTDLISAGQAMMNMYMSMLADYSGAPPVLQGTSASSAAKTATGAQILQHNAQSPLSDTVEDLELDVLIPMMWMTWINAQQYREEETFFEVVGQPMKIRPQDLDIDPEFRWLASSQAANQQQRAAQGMQLIQVLAPLVPLLAQQGKTVDFAFLLSKIYSDGFGFRGFDQLIKDDPMAAMQGMMGGGGAPGMPGAPPPGAQPRSAVPGQDAGTPITPGEGNDFNGVRQNADELSAMMGALNGGGG